jgi:lysophospholipase
MPRRLLTVLPLLIAGAIVARADVDLPQAQRFTFPSADGHFQLSAVRIPAEHPQGIVIVVGGRSESWLKYGALFRDLGHARYTVYSYDHRGQGLSPHLLASHPQIGHVDDFRQYGRDLSVFLDEVKQREKGLPIHLIGHSMGCVVILDSLGSRPDPAIRRIILCSPMFRIKTAPWSEPMARMLLGILHLAGLGASYAPGQQDWSPDEPFVKNQVTSSPEHWAETLEFRRSHPEALTGGASVDWVAQALDSTGRIRQRASSLGPESLILEAGRDELVIPQAPPHVGDKPGPTVLLFPTSRHEILTEREPIRAQALRAILSFLKSPPPPPIPLDHGVASSHISEPTPTIP